MVLWTINSSVVQESSNYRNYKMTVSKKCPSNNGSCCQFITELHVITDLSLNGVTVECEALENEIPSSYRNHLSKYTICLTEDSIFYYRIT